MPSATEILQFLRSGLVEGEDLREGIVNCGRFITLSLFLKESI